MATLAGRAWLSVGAAVRRASGAAAASVAATAASRGPELHAPASFAPPPGASSVSTADAARLADFLRRKEGESGVVCITGAGISTASGIPDYRGPNGSYSKGHVPVQHMEFLTLEERRKRYWARSLLGYRYFYSRKPNAAHFDLAALEQACLVRGIITQNVDTLHTQAGSTGVIDLHGTNDTVQCQSCGATERRAHYQAQVERQNADWIAENLMHDAAGSRDIRAGACAACVWC
jgi:hypothetical protein